MITEEVKGKIAKQPLSLEEMISKRNEEAAAKSKVCECTIILDSLLVQYNSG